MKNLNQEEKLNDINPEPKNSAEEITTPESQEKIEIEAGVETVEDFINALRLSYNQSEDEGEKSKLAHQIVKIEIGLQAAGLNAKDIRVKQMPDGMLGTFNTQDKKISASEDLLEDFNSDQQLFKTVFVHEKTHKEGILDEGLTQLWVKKKLPAATPGIYDNEVGAAKRTFASISDEKLFKFYDIKIPRKLIDYYFEEEIKKNYHKRITERNLEIEVKSLSERLSEKLSKGAEEIFERYKSNNYSVIGKVREELKKRM